MGETSKIEWTDSTWNPWVGCHKVSEGCVNCYMHRAAGRFGFDPNLVRRTSEANWGKPLKWNQERAGERRLVFTCSWSDFFVDEADQWRANAWEIIRQTTNLFWLILTKRPQNIAGRLPADWGGGWPNVGLGVTAENQDMADLRIPALLDIPARLRFVSCEPLLGAICLPQTTALDWIIVGGETGPHARPVHLDWVRSLRDQCQAAGVSFTFKSWGEWVDMDSAIAGGYNRYSHSRQTHRFSDTALPMVRVGHKLAGRTLDGRVWDEKPEVRG